MNVKLAKSAGFCYGVERAVALAHETAQKNEQTAMLGSIIHNANVVAELEREGMRCVQSVEEVTSGETVLLTTVLNAGNNWTATYYELPRYDKYGKMYTYRVEEVFANTLNGYAITYTGTSTRPDKVNQDMLTGDHTVNVIGGPLISLLVRIFHSVPFSGKRLFPGYSIHLQCRYHRMDVHDPHLLSH